MWKEIMETDAGKEFAEWLKEHYYIIYSHNELFATLSEFKNGFTTSVNIINNLAVEWLDNKQHKIYFREENTDNGRVWRVNINVEDLDLYTVTVKGNRQEAIAAGVKKSFQLLEGGE